MPVHEVLVPASGTWLAARVHVPEGDSAAPRPAVVVTGSWLTVKEQMPDLYAARLADEGFVAVTFDFSGFGASGGEPRQVEAPLRKVADLAAVVDWLRSQSGVDGRRIGLLAVCASAQYALAALARGLPAHALVSVAGWFHDRDTVAPFYGGPDGVADRLARADAATRALAAGSAPHLAPAYGPDDARAAMTLEMPYYAEASRGAVPQWRNEVDESSWAHWLTFDAFAAVPDVRVPCLFVHSDDAVLPENVRTIAAALGPLADLDWTTGAQTDFYDQPAQVDHAVAAAVDHLRTAPPLPSAGDRREALVHRFFRAVDTRDWDVVAACAADELRTDYTSLFGGEPETVSAAALLERWRALLPGFDATQHLLGPLVDDGRTVQCNVRGYHHLGDGTWMVAGWYVLELDDTGPAPVVSAITLVVAYEEGDRALVEAAQQRAAGA